MSFNLTVKNTGKSTAQMLVCNLPKYQVKENEDKKIGNSEP